MSERLELGSVEQQWEQFKSELTDKELVECGESIINCTNHLLTICGDSKGEGVQFKTLQDEFQSLMDRYLKLQDSVEEASFLWFKEKMDSFGMRDKFFDMIESHPNKGAIEFV